MNRERFSLLLLEPGEIYFEDFSAVLLKEDSNCEESPGRLKMCSKSLVFESQQRAEPLLKISFKDCSDIEQTKTGLRLFCSQHSLMLRGNMIAPYSFVHEKMRFHFVLNYGSVGDCVQQMNQLKRASSLPACEQNSMIATICHSRYSRMKFDLLWLDDIYDNIILEMDADRITPLVQNPGKVVLTAKTLFFQPCNNIETYPVLKINLSKVKKIFKRRFLLKQMGLEIYSDDPDVPHLYLSFRKELKRNEIYSEIMKQQTLHLDVAEQNEMTMKWQNGVISNYDYLLYLNCLSDRTKNDLTQYPVFPWILSDYTSSEIDLENVDVYRDLSKPIGALNDERLQRLKERYDEMSDPKFLYGSHYSAPGLVLFYLVRVYPQYMLCLQNGRFDHPDRMFNSLPDVYKNCLQNMSDFKELLPEFYDVTNDGDFLINKYGINFGYKHNSTKVDNVELPPWAESPKHFIQIMRNALESDIVSRNLHKWIDLIFGYKQRGEEAVNANNVFYHLCYEGSIDLDDITDMNDRHALEVQIMEFGQIPKQLFQTPHVKRTPLKIPKPIFTETKCDVDLDLKRENAKTSVKNLEILHLFDSHRDRVGSVVMLSNNTSAVSVGHDGLLKMYNLNELKQVMSIRLGSTPLSSSVQIQENIIAVGSWNNDIILYDLEYGRIEDTLRAHNSSINVLLWSPKEKNLISGGWDCAVNIWTLSSISGKGSSRLRLKLIASLDHDSAVTSLALNEDSTLLLSGTEDGEICLWDFSSKSLRKNLPKHNSSITGSAFVWHDKRLITCSVDGELRVTDMVADCQVLSKFVSQGISSLAWNDGILYLGGTEGTLFIWDMHTVEQILEISVYNETISCIAVASDSSYIICGSVNHQIKILIPKPTQEELSS